jgi:hypothetical protein
MPESMVSVVDIEFESTPLRSVGRLDVPLDASDLLRSRAERMQAAINAYGTDRTYYLHNARCVYRFANSDVEGICRFEFEGVVRTDAGDRKCEAADLQVRLVSETCSGVPESVEAWLAEQVRRAVIIEFDRFIAAGQHHANSSDAGSGNLPGLGGMDV